jgi:short-subunit dehydrogenase
MKTALITGATEGIGFEFAKLFAQNNINLVLVARNERRLQEIKNDLFKNGVEVSFYAKDLSITENATEIYNDLISRGISIDYLVNNAGFGIDEEYTEIPWQRELEMFNLNMITLAYFTKVFAKDMKSRGFGKILNLGSTASFQPGPYMAGYCATKAFVLNLSEAVNYEMKGTGVSVTTLCPGVTKTKFHEVAQTGKTLMSKFLTQANPEEVAKYGFTLMMKGKSYGIHGIMNKIMIFSDRLASRKMIIAVSAKLLKGKK